jgi:hypothetical protein
MNYKHVFVATLSVCLVVVSIAYVAEFTDTIDISRFDDKTYR